MNNLALKVLLFYTLSNIYASELRFEDIKQYTFLTQKNSFFITAKLYKQSFKKGDFLKFILNKKNYLLSHNYYQNGYFRAKKTKIYFQKAYKLSGKIHFIKAYGYIKDAKIKAKEIIFDKKNSFKLLQCEITYPKSVLRRNKFLLKY